MKDEDKTKKQLIEELTDMRHRLAELKFAQTELEKTRRDLHRCKELVEKIFLAEKDALIIFGTSAEAEILDCNQAVTEVFGFSREEVLGEASLFFSIDEAAREKFRKHGRKTLDEKDYYYLPEYNLKRKDGTVFPTEQTAIPLFDGPGEPVGYLSVIRDISKQKQTEEVLRKQQAELLQKTQNLEEVNTALKVLLKRREEDRIQLGENVLANVKELVMPYLERLKKSCRDSSQMTFIDIVESNLRNILSPFATKLSSKYFKLTTTEIKVAGQIRDGKTAKEIAGLLNLSVNTIRSHRQNLRIKLGLKNRKINLRSYLRSLQDA